MTWLVGIYRKYIYSELWHSQISKYCMLNNFVLWQCFDVAIDMLISVIVLALESCRNICWQIQSNVPFGRMGRS